MNTKQINCTLDSVPWIASSYAGCFAVDMLPPVHSLPMALVVNADPSSEPGSHWMALYFTVDGHCEFFDSLGREPWVYGYDFAAYVSLVPGRVWKSGTRFQPAMSNVCGHYCIYFIACRCRNLSADYVVKQFNCFALDRNDRLVVSFVRNLSQSYGLLNACRTLSVVQHNTPFI
jgi:hypothetical protein